MGRLMIMDGPPYILSETECNRAYSNGESNEPPDPREGGPRSPRKRCVLLE